MHGTSTRSSAEATVRPFTPLERGRHGKGGLRRLRSITAVFLQQLRQGVVPLFKAVATAVVHAVVVIVVVKVIHAVKVMLLLLLLLVLTLLLFHVFLVDLLQLGHRLL